MNQELVKDIALTGKNGVLPADGADIISKAEAVGLDLRILYQAVIDLSADGLLTANCINLAAGILLQELGLPPYFFAHIQKESLTQLLQAIASSIRVLDGRAALFGRVAHIDFDLSYGSEGQRVRIATEETRDSMEAILEDMLAGHRREYYYSPENGYYTYIIRPETIADFAKEDFSQSPFLYALAGDYSVTPEPTRRRYARFLELSQQSTTPLIQVYNLPESGETRLMFKSDFESPQLPILRKILDDRGYTLVRAYWEPFAAESDLPTSLCSLYIRGELTRRDESALVKDLKDFLSCPTGSANKLYLDGTLSFKEMLFTINAIDFTHLFIFKERENATDKDILSHLTDKDHQDAFAKRIQDSNKSTYEVGQIERVVLKNPDCLKELYNLFKARFDPSIKPHLSDTDLKTAWQKFEKIINSRFIDFPIGYDIFCFMFKIVSATLKTNFYCEEKRSFSFRFDNRILDPLVFSQFVFGIFFVNGHYGCGTHMRAANIARGGLRLLRVSRSNYDSEVDGAVLLNYALGPKAQRIKHKDICESGSKGVVIPHPYFAKIGKEALYDYTEGIMDLILLPESCVVDYYNQSEMVFFGPDEGTAGLMDSVALRSKERGYTHWRTLTTGKSFGIPHDTYGLLDSGKAFGLYGLDDKGVELHIEGEDPIVTTNMDDIFEQIGDNVEISGMTTTSVMSSFRALIEHYKVEEKDLNLMITGGPDGDLGANEIQCYKGKICLIIDGGSILFDPEGLDKKELRKISFMRNGSPRVNSLGYPVDKLSKKGFQVPLGGQNIALPDGKIVDDCAMFHRTFLTAPENRVYLEQANIQAFIPCGGFKDTINRGNVKDFIHNCNELRFIVEGANVFFDDSARRYIATKTSIKQIKDSSANKGGVFSSSIAEVLTAFLLGDSYESQLLEDHATQWGLIKDIMMMVSRYAQQETKLLLQLHEANPETPLFDLSEKTSELIFELQDKIEEHIEDLASNKEILSRVLQDYIPPVLTSKLGLDYIIDHLGSEELRPYRNAILSKKIAAMAYYKYGTDWDRFTADVEKNFEKSIVKALND
ncbi:NAD-glutamate dehydrogenase domain-containing protein [Desulforhopalus sp. 52FAK]